MSNFNRTIFKPLMGAIITKIEGATEESEEIRFTLENGDIFRMYHEQDCCEDVRIEDISGNIDDLIGSQILLAEEVTNEGDLDYGDTCTWTWYNFATIKGYVTIRWFGESNGYYSESVNYELIKKKDEVSNKLRRYFNPSIEERIEDIDHLLALLNEQIGHCSTCRYYRNSMTPGFVTAYGECLVHALIFPQKVCGLKDVECSDYMENTDEVMRLKAEREQLKKGENNGSI